MRPIERPDCELAHSVEFGVCGAPECGLHLIPSRRDGAPICEAIIDRDQLRELLQYIHECGLDL